MNVVEPGLTCTEKTGLEGCPESEKLIRKGMLSGYLRSQPAGCLLTLSIERSSDHCLARALLGARAGLDELVFLSPASNEDGVGHVLLRDRASGFVREPNAAFVESSMEAEEYARACSFVVVGAVTPEVIQGLLSVPPAERARYATEAGGTLAAIAHRRFGMNMPGVGTTPRTPPPPPPPHGGKPAPVHGGSKAVDAWLNSLGGTLSKSQKDELEQTSKDVKTWLAWFHAHKRGSPALNKNVPKNVVDAENRLWSNPSIRKQIRWHGNTVSRDTLGKFLKTLDSAAGNAEKTFQEFQRKHPTADAGLLKQAAQASILQGDLPLLDAASKGAKVDGKFDIQDVQAIAHSDASGVPAPLKEAAAAFDNRASFTTLADAGSAGKGLANNGSFQKLIPNEIGFSLEDKAVHQWVDSLGNAVSAKTKHSLTQIGDDAVTLQNWFSAHKRGASSLNVMPKNVADAEKQLLSNPLINKELHVGKLVTRDAVNPFVSKPDSAAKAAEKDWNSFKKGSGSSNPVARQIALAADVLRADLPVYYAAGSKAAQSKNCFNGSALQAIANHGKDAAGLPQTLKNAASLFGNSGMFYYLDVAGDNPATVHADGLANGANLDSFVGKEAGPLFDSRSLGSTLSSAAMRSMVSGVDTTKLGPDVLKNPQKYSPAQKMAMMLKLEDLNTRLHAGVAEQRWVYDLFDSINGDPHQVAANIAQDVAQLGNASDVKKFYKDHYPRALQSIAQADPKLKQALSGYYEGAVKDGSALKNALTSKDSSGKTPSVESGLAGFLQTAHVLNLALGADGNKKDKKIHFQGIVQKSGEQKTLEKAYQSDIVSAKRLKHVLDHGRNVTSAVTGFMTDVANFGAALPGKYVSSYASELQKNFTDTITSEVLGNATWYDLKTAFLGSNGKVDTAKLTQAVEEAFKKNPSLGKDSKGQSLKVEDVVNLLSSIVNSSRNGVKLEDSLNKYAKAKKIDGPGEPTGAMAKAYKLGILHVTTAVLIGGVLAAQINGSSGTGKGIVAADALAAGMGISGYLLQGGAKYAKNGKYSFKTLTKPQFDDVESSGKVLSGGGGALAGALGIFSGLNSLKSGHKVNGAVAIATGTTDLLSGVATAAEGGLALAGASEDVVAIAGAVAGAVGDAAAVVTQLATLGLLVYEDIKFENQQLQFTNEFVGDAKKLGITGGDQLSNDPPSTAP